MPSTMTDKRGPKIIHNKILQYQGKVEEYKCFQKTKRTLLLMQILAHTKQVTKKLPIVELCVVSVRSFRLKIWYSLAYGFLPFCILFIFGKFKVTLNFRLKCKSRTFYLKFKLLFN